ncbi:hypothetical protein RBU49_10265 [Clostridium sp. MB40-C1]|uniref:hypothetical protein n=1 Tax=Clostridium sp. MB40-C1 TaxID=3070996 RepID=UPI0027DED010|nr:hypothetical protein [Clostridium sp. MB40-C1]WMJ79273.1 hypothetical protein RBU49_10265 [Clostridium sp. MB40-C1]
MDFLLSKEEWIKVKARGRKDYVLKMWKTLIITVILSSGLFNVCMIMKKKIPMNAYRYLLTIFVIPFIIGTVYTYAVVYFTWKINSMAYDFKEENPKKYKKNIIINTSINLVIVLSMINFSAHNLFLKSLYEFLGDFAISTVIAAVIGAIFGVASWKKAYKKAMS